VISFAGLRCYFGIRIQDGQVVSGVISLLSNRVRVNGRWN